jgi:hypothetical protein
MGRAKWAAGSAIPGNLVIYATCGRADRPVVQRPIDQRPAMVLGTHCRPLVGHRRFRGDGVFQLPCGGSSSEAGPAAG